MLISHLRFLLHAITDLSPATGGARWSNRLAIETSTEGEEGGGGGLTSWTAKLMADERNAASSPASQHNAYPLSQALTADGYA